MLRLDQPLNSHDQSTLAMDDSGSRGPGSHTGDLVKSKEGLRMSTKTSSTVNTMGRTDIPKRHVSISYADHHAMHLHIPARQKSSDMGSQLTEKNIKL